MAHRAAPLHSGARRYVRDPVDDVRDEVRAVGVGGRRVRRCGAAFAEGLAERGVNVVLLARRQSVLGRVAAEIENKTSAQTRTVAIDLAQPGAAAAIAAATGDLEIGMLVYCAGADPNFTPFLANSIEAAEAMVQRNCMVPMQLCHHYAPAMVRRGSGGIVLFGSGAGLAGRPNMVAYGASKAFDMVFAEALWAELQPKGVDVLGLILGKTDTPALRALEYSRGQIGSAAEAPADAAPSPRSSPRPSRTWATARR